MDDINRIAGILQSIGFECIRCGTCCYPVEMDSNLVMVTPAEIRQIMDYSGLTWEEVAEPYPESIDDGMNHVYTLGWCIRRLHNECRFLNAGRCKIYQNRPWICKTYPFMLDGDEVRTYPCPGIGREISWEDACDLGQKLIERQNAEVCDEMKVNQIILQNWQMPKDHFIVIDSEGIKRFP
jgi:Fe-S-cluster containining protein